MFLRDYIDFIIDDSPLKQGLFSPGLHIPDYSSSVIKEKKIDYLLILAWNFAEDIITKLRATVDWPIKCIVPLPELEIIDI